MAGKLKTNKKKSDKKKEPYGLNYVTIMGEWFEQNKNEEKKKIREKGIKKSLSIIDRGLSVISLGVEANDEEFFGKLFSTIPSTYGQGSLMLRLFCCCFFFFTFSRNVKVIVER